MTVKCVRQLQKQQTNTGIDIISQCNKCNCWYCGIRGLNITICVTFNIWKILNSKKTTLSI
jgi:hypothetical protein